jgi:hypothetical protein
MGVATALTRKEAVREKAMNPSRSVSIRALFLVAVSFLCTLPMVASAQVTLRQIGHPTWEPVDAHIFTAPIGTVESPCCDLFLDTATTALPPPNHVPDSILFIGPGAPHDPPYDQEFAAGLASSGFREATTFSTSEFSLPSAVYAMWMIVPTARSPYSGKSQDFESGPIIPNELFPITVNGTALRNAQAWDPFVGNFVRDSLPVIGTLYDPVRYQDVDGDSHFPVFYADAIDFGPAVDPAAAAASYEYQVEMRDSTGAGWDISARFRVNPHHR